MKWKYVSLLSIGLLVLTVFTISYFYLDKDEISESYNLFKYHQNDIHCPIPIFTDEKLKDVIESDYCKFEFPDWIYIRNNSALFNDTIYHKIGGFKCYFKIMKWNGDFQSSQDGNWKYFYNNTYLGNLLLRVLCKGRGLFNYNEHYLFGFEETYLKNQISSPDILVVGIDSLSRMAWKKFLPLSYEFIENKMFNSSTIFKKVNVRGDGTTINLLAILTGEEETDLYESRRNEPGARQVDDYPWIWRILKPKGYKTYFDDEDIKFGTFQYRLLGFQNQPTDYYSRTWRLLHELRKQNKPCMNQRNYFQFQLDSVEHFFKTIKSPKFAFIWSSYFSHYHNELVRKLDHTLLNFLDKINNPNGVFKNTIFVLLSDHGHRFDSRNNLRGKYEERLPFLAVNIPKMIIDKHEDLKKSLKINENKLVTLYDIHEMFLDAIDNFPVNPSANIVKNSRKISVFNSEMPHRSCSDVKVAAHWCVCLKWKTINPNQLIIRDSVSHVIDTINSYTEEYRSMCHRLDIYKIIRANMVAPSREVVKFKHSDKDGRKGFFTDDLDIGRIYYRVTFQTVPGDAIFESTVNVEKNPINNKPLFHVQIKDIDRNNKYDEWIWCITNKMRDVRKYCLCR